MMTLDRAVEQAMLLLQPHLDKALLIYAQGHIGVPAEDAVPRIQAYRLKLIDYGAACENRIRASLSLTFAEPMGSA